MKRTYSLGKIISSILYIVFCNMALATTPEWVSTPKSDDTGFTYGVGYGTGMTRTSARKAAFEDALNKLAISITERPRKFILKNVDVLEGCEYFKSFPPVVKCWVQVSFPLHDRKDIVNRIAVGDKLNNIWRQNRAHMNSGKFAECRKTLKNIAEKYENGLYMEFNMDDIDMVIGDTYLGEKNPEEALLIYRSFLDSASRQADAVARMLKVADYYKECEKYSDAGNLYNEIINMTKLDLEVMNTVANHIICIGDHFKSKGDFSLAHDYYKQVASNNNLSLQVRNEAEKCLKDIPKPPRAWNLNKSLGNGNIGLICLKRKNGKTFLFSELSDAIILDFNDARLTYCDISKNANMKKQTADHIFDGLEFSPMQSNDGKPLTHLIAILLDVNIPEYGSRLDGRIKAVVYDYDRKVLLNNISFKERVTDVPPSVQADHISGVLFFNYLCPKDNLKPLVRVAPLDAKSGIGESLGRVMTKSFKSSLIKTDRYRVTSDSDALFYRKLMASDRHNQLDYIEYGHAASSFLINCSVSKVGDTYHMMSQMLDLELDTTHKQATTDFKSISGEWLNYEMQRNMCELIGMKPPRPPAFWKRKKDIISGTYSNLPDDMRAVERAVNINFKRLDAGSVNAFEDQKKLAIDQDIPIQVKTKKTEIEFCLVPKGSLVTRSGQVVEAFSKPVYVSKCEITQKQWKLVMLSKETPAVFKDDNSPIENIRWQDARQFCERLCALEGVEKGGYRLPTSVEWEYFCRAGTLASYYTGEGEHNLKTAAWFKNNVYSKRTQKGGKLACNAWGLYDTIGNVWEWTVETRKSGRTKGVPRGGCWNSSAAECEVMFRAPYVPVRANVIGFRILKVIDIK